jgi:hypothetical protein
LVGESPPPSERIALILCIAFDREAVLVGMRSGGVDLEVVTKVVTEWSDNNGYPQLVAARSTALDLRKRHFRGS